MGAALGKIGGKVGQLAAQTKASQPQKAQGGMLGNMMGQMSAQKQNQNNSGLLNAARGHIGAASSTRAQAPAQKQLSGLFGKSLGGGSRKLSAMRAAQQANQRFSPRGRSGGFRGHMGMFGRRR